MGTSNSHNHNHSHDHKNSPKHDQKCKDPSHNHPHPHNNQPKTQKKIMKDSIILPQYGGEVVIDKINKVVVRKIQVFDFERQFVQSVVSKRMLLRHPNLITVKNYSFESLDDNEEFDSRTDLQKSLYFCYPQSHILRLQFDPAIIHVHSLIKQYCQKRQPIQQPEVRRIIGSVVQCLIYLKSKGTFHGDIKPTSIFINPKTQAVQLVDSFFVNNGRSGYEIVNEDPGCESFMTPQQLQLKKQKAIDSLEKIYASEVFCIGLTLLEMMTFESSMQIYDLKELQINKEFLQRKAVQMQTYGYSQELADLALRCIHKDPSKRLTHEQIQQRLQGNTPV